jgi:uncharacterized protein YidB (DUF937 family)
MNGNPLLGQVLGGVFGHAMGRRGMGGMRTGGLGGGMGGMGGGLGGAALGSVLGGMLGRGRAPVGRAGLGGGHSALLMMMLPMAMRWVQQQGGMGAVLKRFQQKGMDRQAQSWVSKADNEAIDERAVEEVVGHGELAQMAQRLGVPEHEVAQAFAEIMPEMVDKLTPDGQLDARADEVLDEGRTELEREIEQLQQQQRAPH